MIDPLVEEYARTDEARFEFRHFSLAPNDTTLAAIAAEAAGEQARQWQYLDTFVRNQDLAISRGVDEELLREIAEAVPQLEVEHWEEDFEAPESEELVREDAVLAAELELPAEPAVVVSGPGGQRELIESPSAAEIEAAIGRGRLSAGSRAPRASRSRVIRRPCRAGVEQRAARSARRADPQDRVGGRELLEPAAEIDEQRGDRHVADHGRPQEPSASARGRRRRRSRRG